MRGGGGRYLSLFFVPFWERNLAGKIFFENVTNFLCLILDFLHGDDKCRRCMLCCVHEVSLRREV